MPEKKPDPDPMPGAEPEKLFRTEFLSKRIHDALMNARPEDLIHPDPRAEIIKGGANPSGGWLHSPAHLELFAAADKRLTQVAELGGQVVKQVERVHAVLVKGSTVVVIQAAPSGDLSAIRVTRYDGFSAAWINLISLLGPARLLVETGYRERFDIGFVPEGSILWPGLTFDLSQPQERRQEPVRRRRNSSPGA